MGAAMGSDASVYVVDDDDDVRTGLCRLLRSAGWDVLDFASAPAFLEAYDPERVSCLLLDVSMPEMTGPELHETLGERGIDIPVVFLTGKGDVGTSVRALKRGALDFLEKPVDAEVLLEAIGTAVERSREARAQRGQQDEAAERYAQLSAREREVMAHVIRGRLNKQIAYDMGIALKTVKVHRGRVMAKMQVRSVAELVRLCDRLGLRPA